MEKSKTAEEIRALLLSQRPDLKEEFAKISDLELLQFMACAYKSAIDIKEPSWLRSIGYWTRLPGRFFPQISIDLIAHLAQ